MILFHLNIQAAAVQDGEIFWRDSGGLAAQGILTLPPYEERYLYNIKFNFSKGIFKGNKEAIERKNVMHRVT
jgi:hypothetical protein